MDHNASPQNSVTTHAEQSVYFPRSDGSRIPYKVYSSPEVYRLEQERIFHGPVWSFLALEAEIPRPGDFKGTFVGDTPVVMTRTDDGTLAAPRGSGAFLPCALSEAAKPLGVAVPELAYTAQQGTALV